MEHLSSRIELALDYRTLELGAEQAKEIAGYYSRVLAAMSAEPAAYHETVCLLSVEEQGRLLVELNETAAPFSDEKCVHELFEEQERRAPEAIAVRLGSEELSYRELNLRANKLARYVREHPCEPARDAGDAIAEPAQRFAQRPRSRRAPESAAVEDVACDLPRRVGIDGYRCGTGAHHAPCGLAIAICTSNASSRMRRSK